MARVEPLEWRDFVDDAHPDVQAFEQWLNTLKPPFRQRVVGELDALLEQAAEGGIPFDPGAGSNPRSQLVPIRRDPDLYELRVTLLSKKVRQYHAEPPEDPQVLVALHLHIKTSKEQQDDAISNARTRYRAGERDGWLK